MTRTFRLECAGEYGSVSPSSGEELGAFLSKAAEESEVMYRRNPDSRVMFWGWLVAQVYHLAADAYDMGASASIGHNRADRYMQRSRAMRLKAERLEAEAKQQRDEVEAASMKACFLAGYEGLNISSYSFERHDAALVGQHFAKHNLPFPDVVRLDRGTGRDRIMAGGCLYEVEYPNGRIPDAIVRLVDE